MKVSQLLNEWLLSIQPTVKESTYAKYSFLVQKHINSELGDILLSNLTTEDISCFTAGKLNGGNLSDGSALSPKTVADLLSILKLALTFAAERNYPCPNHIIIKKPRQTLPQIQVLSVEEQEKLEQYIFTHFEPAGIGIILSLYTGLRIGDDDDKIRLNQRKPSKYKGLSRFGPEKNLQRINKFMKERPTFYKKLIQMKENFRFYLRCFYCITKVVILQFNSEKQDRISS